MSHSDISNRDRSQKLANYLENVNPENFRFCGGQFGEKHPTVYKTDFDFFWSCHF